MWKNELFDKMICELDSCSAKNVFLGRIKTPNDDHDHTVRVFTRLVLQGQVKSAVCWLSKRSSGGKVLLPNDILDASGKSVMDVLKEKAQDADVNAFINCEEWVLPLLVNVDITAGHIEQHFLLKFGSCSEIL